MIILLQSVTIQFRRLFWHILYYKVRQSNFITKCDRLLLQSASGITKCDRLYYNVRQVLQSVRVINVTTQLDNRYIIAVNVIKDTIKAYFY